MTWTRQMLATGLSTSSSLMWVRDSAYELLKLAVAVGVVLASSSAYDVLALHTPRATVSQC